MEDTPEIIQRLRRHQNWSVRQLALNANTPYKPLLRVLNGRQAITLDTAIRVADALGVTLPDITPTKAVAA